MEEKRKFVRIEWPVVVQYKTSEEPLSKDQVVGRDISEGGVSFVVYERLTKGTQLNLEIQVPFDSMPIFAKGKIAWVKKIGEEHEKLFEVGFEFTGMETRDNKRLKAYIANEITERGKKS